MESEDQRHEPPIRPRSRAAETRVADHLRRQRLVRMIELAQSYLGCSKTQLALALNRDPAKVVPDSGNPKLDLVMGLSDVLDWPAGDVAEALWIDPLQEALGQEPLPQESFEELNRLSLRAHREGDHQEVRRLCGQMLRIASTPRERGLAANRLSVGFDQAGRYAKALEWARIAANIPDLPSASRLLYMANLANAHSMMWQLHEAIGVASTVLNESESQTQNDVLQCAKGVALYVAGSARRRVIAEQPNRLPVDGPLAVRQLEGAIVLLEDLAARRSDDSYSGIANSCRGGLIELRVLLGEIDPIDGVGRLLEGVERITDPQAVPRGDWLESWGWWAVYGLNIAVRHLRGDDQDRFAAVFSTKAHEIADRLENWAIREQVFSLEHSLKSGISTDDADKRAHWVLDREDLRTLLGTMGRFPWFRVTGWRILSRATLV